MHTKAVLLALAMYACAGPATGAQERVLRADLELTNQVATVWEWWTTEAGLTSFFAPGARIDARVDGELDVLFSPDSPAGRRGAEGLRIVALEPSRRLLFTWNAPPQLPSIRAQRTIVEIRLEARPSGGTHLTFLHWGWGVGPEWDKAYDYFAGAWNGFVLPSLQHRDAHGPIDWTKPPNLQPLVPSLKHALSVVPNPTR